MNQQQTNPQFAKKALVVAMAAVFAASPAGAQQESAQIDEIIVTAEKREESIQNVGMSISAFDADGLAKAGVVDVSRINFLVPGVNYAYAGYDAKFNVRGANSTNTFSDNSSIVGTYVDGVYKSRASQTTAAFFDVERLEFLKGPQGTLYGRNTFAGAMNLWSNKPDLEGISGGVDASYSRFNTVRTGYYFNYPVSDQFALRVAGYNEVGDGFIKNTAGPNLGVPDGFGVRVSALWDLDNVDVLFRYSHNQKDGASAGIFGYTNICANVTAQGITDHTGSSSTCTSSRFGSDGGPGFNDPYTVAQDYAPDDVYGEDHFNLTITWDAGPVTITSITSYTDFENLLQFDADYSANNFSLSGFDETAESVTQELQFSSNSDGPLQWTGGLYYSNDETLFSFNVVNVVLHDDSGVVTVTGPDGMDYTLFYPGTPLLNNIYNLNGHFADHEIIDTDTLGVYAQVEYSVSDKLRLIAGLRYNDESKELIGGGSTFSGGGAVTTILSGVQPVNTPQITRGSDPFAFDSSTGFTADESFTNTSWKAGIEYDLNDDAMLYFTAATGFLSGAMNPFGGSTDEQESEMYEVGIKSILQDGRLLLNLSVHSTEYTNLLTQFQVSVGDPPVVSTTSINGGAIDAFGVELDSQYVLDNWTLDLKVAWLDAEFGVYGQTYPYQLLGGVASGFTDVKGQTPGWSPDLTVAFGVDYLISLNSGATLTPRLQFYSSSEFFTGNLFAPDLNQLQDSYTKTDISLTWRSADGKYSLAAFVENIEDEAVLARGNNGGSDNVQTSFLYPQNYGVRFTASWE